jgi:hypothetical protein
MNVIYCKKVCNSWEDFIQIRSLKRYGILDTIKFQFFLFLVEVLRQETNKHKICLFASHITATFVCGYCCHVCGLYLFPSGKKIEILPFFQRITITTFNIMAQKF